MKHEENEILDALIAHARTQEEVLTAFMAAFPKTDAERLHKKIGKKWNEYLRNKTNVSLRHCDTKTLITVLRSLNNDVREAIIRKVEIKLVKKPKVYKEIYEAMTHKTNAWNQDLQREKYVELVSISSDGYLIQVWNGLEMFTFTIYDVNQFYPALKH